MDIKQFPSVPINSDRLYVMGVASSGCEIYMPVINMNDKHTQKMKKALQDYLDSQIPEQPGVA